MKKRLLSILLTLCMALSLLSAVAFAEGGAKAIQSGTGSIHSYDTSAGGYSYIYYGTWRNSPIKWRVLDTKANTGAADALFLLTDECLYPLPGDLYACYIQFNPADKQNRHLWKDSTLQGWFKSTFYSGENSAFTSAERALIPATTQASSVFSYKAPGAPSWDPGMRFQICGLEAEHVFAPSIQDVVNAAYGFTDSASRIAGPSNSLGPGTRYWLRSFEISEQLPFMVGEDASLMGDWGDNPSAVRPAMNLSTAGNNILFVSAAEGGKPAGGLAEISEYTGNEWKLTLLDSSRSGFAVTTTDLSAYTRSGTVKIGYTGAKTGTNEYVSAMILDAAGNPAYYGRSSAALTDENGTAELTIPALAEGTYTLKVFNEQYNGDKMTDLASAFADVTLTVENKVEEQFTLTPGGRYYFDLSAMNIPGTVNTGNSLGATSLPDTTLHYVPFTYAGTIEAYKLTSATATTEEYAQQNKYAHSLFVADYAVTHTVSWDDLNTAGLIFGKDYAAGGVGYTLRAPSCGSGFTDSGDSERGTPQSNEWDAVLNKNSGYIQNWNQMYSWGQDAYFGNASDPAVRGYASARRWNLDYAAHSIPDVGFRPVLEILNPDALGSDGLKVVTLDLGGGTLGGSSDAIQIIVKNGSDFTAPASDGMTRPDGDTGNFFMWRGSNGKFYVPGDSVPADVTALTGQWTAPTYTVTLHANGGTINSGNVTGYTYGVGATLPAADDMTYTGHTFKGWYDNENLTGSPVTAIGGAETGNKEYWAKWEINQYTVTVKPENGKADIIITQDYGTPITAPTLTREGYTFKGWDKEIPETMPADNITVKAQWEINQYTIAFDTNGGSEITPITQDYGTEITAPDNPTRKGYTFKGWDKEIPETMPAENITVKAQWEINQYTIAFDTNGGSEIAPITQDYGTEITAPDNPTRKGYTFKGWDKEIPETMPAENMTVKAQWKINQYTITFDTNGGSEIAPITQDYGTEITAPDNPTRKGYTFKGWDKEISETMPAENITITARWKDTEKPTGEIIIGTNKWNQLLNELTFGIFFKDTQEVTINAVDNSGVVFVSYLVTDKELSESELNSLVFRAYEEPFCIDPNGEYIVYVMLVDENINITYLRSDRITLDNIQPVISGIENGKTYCEAQTVIVDEKYVDTVTVNGTVVTLDADGGFVLPPTNGEQKIVVTDKAGNNAEMTVTVNNGHTFGEWVSDNDGKHTRKCIVDGCDAFETENCSGGNATCTEKAVCDVCGKAYGEFDGTNHEGGVQEWTTRTAFNHEQKWNCCGAVIVASEAHEWKDGVCRECGYVCLHNDADKDHICDYCKKTISEHVDKDKNHICDYCEKTISAHEDAPTEEIKKADTVTAKLPDDSKSPQTGDNSNLILWIALLIISGGVMKGVTAFGKSKKHSAKIKDK